MPTTTDQARTSPPASGFDYPERRLKFQSEWHSKKALSAKRSYHTLEFVILLSGVLIPMASLLPAGHAPWATAILGALVVLAGGANKLFKYHENWLRYRAVDQALVRELEMYRAAAGEYALETEGERNAHLVQRTEFLLAGVTEQYLASHRPEKSGRDQL